MFAGIGRTLCCVLAVSALMHATPVWAGPRENQSKHPESPRQLATVEGIAHKSKAPLAPASHDNKQPFLPELAQIKKNMPRDLQEAADRGCQAAREGIHLVAARFDQAGKWLAHIAAQMNSLPVVTPVGSPYVSKSDRHLRIMPDGRLKTVVEQ